LSSSPARVKVMTNARWSAGWWQYSRVWSTSAHVNQHSLTDTVIATETLLTQHAITQMHTLPTPAGNATLVVAMVLACNSQRGFAAAVTAAITAQPKQQYPWHTRSLQD
jgi:hypothetical protein